MYFSEATCSLFLFKSHNEIRCQATFLILDLKDEERKKSEILLTTKIDIITKLNNTFNEISYKKIDAGQKSNCCQIIACISSHEISFIC